MLEQPNHEVQVLEWEGLDNHITERVSPNTTHLELRYCVSTDWEAVGLALCRLARLSSLEMWEPKCDSNFIQSLGNCQQLTQLIMSSWEVTEPRAKAIATHLKLTSLVLRYGKLSNQTLGILVGSLNKLQRLSISSNPQLGDKGAVTIANNLPELTELKLHDCGIADQGLLALCSSLKQLTSLNLTQNARITQTGVAGAVCSLTKLTQFHLSESNIGSAGAETIAKGLPMLTALTLGTLMGELEDCGIGEQGAFSVGRNLLHLSTLGVQCNNLSTEILSIVATDLNRLRIYRMDHNHFDDRMLIGLGQLTNLEQFGARSNYGGLSKSCLEKLYRLLTLAYIWN